MLSLKKSFLTLYQKESTVNKLFQGTGLIKKYSRKELFEKAKGKMNITLKNSWLVIVLGLVLILYGCGADGGNNNDDDDTGNNTETQQDVDDSEATEETSQELQDEDTGTTEDTKTPDVIEEVEEETHEEEVEDGDCSKNGYTAVREGATVVSFGLQYQAHNAEEDPHDKMMVQIYTDFDGPTEPGTYDLNGINYKDCGLCLMANSDCNGDSCDKTFYAEQGSVTITSLGGLGDNFAAEFHNVVFDEVTIGSDYVSTPVPGGETWCVDGFAFDSPISDYTEQVCSQEDINCVGETIPDFSLMNCRTGRLASMYDVAEGKKAMWFVMTAGWCSACHAWIPQVMNLDDQYSDDGLEVIYVLGENDNEGEPTLAYCREYANRYTEDVQRFYIDHDGESSYAASFAALWPYIDSNGMFGLPFNAIIDAETKEYRYADNAPGVELNAILEELLQ